jgi:hypothetical protein
MMALRALLAAVAAAAIAVGLALPAVRTQAEPKSQIEQIEVGRN